MEPDTRNMKYVLILGNIAEGYVFLGPFNSADEAFDWSDNNPRDRDDIVYVSELGDPNSVKWGDNEMKMEKKDAEER